MYRSAPLFLITNLISLHAKATLPPQATDEPPTEAMITKMSTIQVNAAMQAQGLVLTFDNNSSLKDKKQHLLLHITNPVGNHCFTQCKWSGRPAKNGTAQQGAYHSEDKVECTGKVMKRPKAT
jgi:hypothetical protein